MGKRKTRKFKKTRVVCNSNKNADLKNQEQLKIKNPIIDSKDKSNYDTVSNHSNNLSNATEPESKEIYEHAIMDKCTDPNLAKKQRKKLPTWHKIDKAKQKQAEQKICEENLDNMLEYMTNFLSRIQNKAQKVAKQENP